MKPKISVCVPTYNGSLFLRECLDSIILQSFSDFELLIVDDCSSDNTVEIAEEYAAIDSRIAVHKNHQNLGLVGNWNRCIEIASGEWIKFVFQDDKIAPSCLEKLFTATKLGKPIVYCRREFIFESDTPEATKTWYLTHISSCNPFGDSVDISAQQYAALTLKNIGINLIGEPTSLMIHRNVFFEFGCFNPHTITVCDFEFSARIAINTGITQVPEVLAQFRVHGTSETSFCGRNRHYRAKILDELILIHDFAFHVTYEPLRAVARQSLPEIDLVRLFEQETISAWKIARREQRSSDKESDFSPHRELAEVSRFYPLIASIIESNTLELWKYDVSLIFDFLVMALKSWVRIFPPIAWYLKFRASAQ
jgi:glycosyltransferase involved in cell wall biosynthesis